ncbi:UPF0481 protein At3g47200-like [Silene latifolia]|uniref:UPF0481 protein At3g47200-like n=1 Tax=Silene latifolia TaxID=37657 RepID=UPI003D77700F
MTVFLNLIAYEQCHLRQYWEMCITDYVSFMFNLLNSASDVKHLKKAGIIVSQIGSDAEVVDLFNRLLKKVVVNWTDGSLSNLYMELSIYCNHKRHRWLASWRNDYFNKPWVIISIIAVILLLFLTALQTACIILYYKSQQ